MLARIILLGGTSSVGKSTTASLLQSKLSEITSKKIVVLSLDGFASDDLRKKAKQLESSVLQQFGFDPEVGPDAYQALSFEQRKLMQDISASCYYEVIHKQIAKSVLEHIKNDSIVILDVLNFPSMVYWLARYIPAKVPVLSVLLRMPLTLYPERISERNKQAMLMHKGDNVDALLKDARFCLRIMNQIGEIFESRNEPPPANLEQISKLQVQQILQRASLLEKGLLEYIVQMPANSPEDIALKSFFVGELQQYQKYEESNIQFTTDLIAGQQAEKFYLAPKFEPDIVIDVSAGAPDAIMKRIFTLVQSNVSVDDSLNVFDLYFKTNRLHAHEMLLSYSMHLHKKEAELAQSDNNNQTRMRFIS